MAKPRKNKYHWDAFKILKHVSKNIAEDMLESDLDVIHNILFFAIGTEKLLKGIICGINPLFVLSNPDFKNACAVQYSGQVKNNEEVSKKPNGDVIAFQSSVLRASVFSHAVLDNKNTLLKLKNARDIIAHCNLAGLDIDELRILLKRDFYPLLDSIDKELSLGGQTNFFNNFDSQLALIASSLQDDISKKIELKIRSAKSRWKQMSGSKFFKQEECEATTASMLRTKDVYPAECPICTNDALLYTEPILEFNPYLRKEIQVGIDPKKLECKFCRFESSDYKELDYLKIEPEQGTEFGFVRRIEAMQEQDATDEIELHLSSSIWEITDSEEFGSAIAATNACGFDIDEYSVGSYQVEDDCIQAQITFSSSGEQGEDKMFCGNKISGSATVLIREDDSVEYQEILASVDDYSD